MIRSTIHGAKRDRPIPARGVCVPPDSGRNVDLDRIQPGESRSQSIHPPVDSLRAGHRPDLFERVCCCLRPPVHCHQTMGSDSLDQLLVRGASGMESLHDLAGAEFVSAALWLLAWWWQPMEAPKPRPDLTPAA